MTAIRSGRIYEVEIEGVTQGWSFNRTGYLAIGSTLDSNTTQNGINPVEVLLQSGSPALNFESGAIQFATNSSFHIDATNAQLDLTYVEQPSENEITIFVDERISATGSNLFNSTSSLQSLYQIFEGGMALRFSDDGSTFVGAIDIKGTFSLTHRPASYSANIFGTLAADSGDDDSNSPNPTPEPEPEPTPEPTPEPDSEEGLLNTDIFRFQNTSVPGTYLYAATAEAQNIRENFTNFDEEGFAFQVGIEPGDDLIPLYRFQSNVTPGTYLFVGEDERRS